MSSRLLINSMQSITESSLNSENITWVPITPAVDFAPDAIAVLPPDLFHRPPVSAELEFQLPSDAISRGSD